MPSGIERIPDRTFEPLRKLTRDSVGGAKDKDNYATGAVPTTITAAPATTTAQTAATDPRLPLPQRLNPWPTPWEFAAYDYDCAGGNGDGPLYTGRVVVVGPHVYGLDGNGDGVGCE